MLGIRIPGGTNGQLAASVIGQSFPKIGQVLNRLLHS
jgi:hypothetical protein